MIFLVLVGLVAGLLAGISPCILPVLPVVLFGGSATATVTAPDKNQADGDQASQNAPADRAPRRGPGRSLALVAGLVLSFSLVVLAGSEILSLLGLPQDTLTDIGIALLILVGLGYLIPQLGELFERPFARIGARRPSRRGGGLLLGLALGVLYVPCAGPVLAAITVVGATHRVGLRAIILTAAFAIGTAVPLLAFALAGSQLANRVTALRRRAPRVRQAGGVVLIVMALAIAFNVLGGLQRDVPGYATALQGSAKVRKELNGLTGVKATSLTNCDSEATSLVNCGPAPDFTGITAWLNTPGGKPLSMAGLRGKVVLVDFWTYSCINCQRTLPHVEAWYKKYKKDGLVVVGVHTPEFAFEHVVSNVRAQAAALGVKYPVAVDDKYATWNAYDNEYWPADYLIDAQGDVVHVHFGEGDYGTTESLIRQLLRAAHPTGDLPAATDVPDRTPTGEMSPETYVGYEREQYLDSAALTRNSPARYYFPRSLPLGKFALSGTWTDGKQEATAGTDARLELRFLAGDVYLVAGGHGTLSVSLNGRHTQTISVGGVPKLYTLVHGTGTRTGTLELRASPGIQAYDFTFG